MQYFCIQFAFNSKLYLSFSFYPDTLHLVIVSHSVIVLTTFFNELMGKKTKASKMALFQQRFDMTSKKQVGRLKSFHFIKI